MTAAERAARRAELRREYRERKARELEGEGEGDAALELRAGRCACRCGAELGTAVRAFYIDSRHRQRHHRRRLEAAAEAAGVPARLSLQALQTTNRARDRHGDAPARPRARKRGPRPGVTVYLPSVELAGDLRAILERTPWTVLGIYWTDEELELVLEVLERALERRRRRDIATDRAAA